MGGTKMKHFTTEEWIDFVNQVTSPKQQEAMKKHLGTGCKQCKESVALWQKLHKTAAMEAMYQPPQADVRLAKAAFAAAGAGAHRNKKSSLSRSDVRQSLASDAGGRAVQRIGNQANALPR